MEMKNPVIIIGASKGLGYALSELYAKNGHVVIGLSRTTESLEKLKEKYSNINPINFDLNNYADPAAHELIKNRILNINRRVDIVAP